MTEFSEHRLTQNMSFDPSSTAVLVVDMLNDFCEPEGAMPLPDSELLYPPIQSLLEAARAGGSPVIWLCDEHPPGDKEFEKRTEHCLVGSWGAQVVDALKPPPGEYRVPKRRYSGFFETDLDLRLRELGIEHLIITGVVTNICVRSTVHDAFFRGYNVIVPEDCVGDHEEGPHRDNLRDVGRRYCDVVTCDEVIAYIEDWQRRNDR